MQILDDNKKIITLMGVLFSCIIVVMTLIAVVVNGNPLSADNSLNPSNSSPNGLLENLDTSEEDEEESGHESLLPQIENLGTASPNNEFSVLTFNKPRSMLAATISPGSEYLTGDDNSQSTVEKQIDTAIANAVELQMNTVILEVGNQYGVAYPSGWYPQLAVAYDPLEYAINAARDNGLYVYLIYDLCKDVLDDTIVKRGDIDISFLDDMTLELEAFVKTYKVDGILFTNYTNPHSDTSYIQYLHEGMGIGYENYMSLVSKKVVEIAKEVVRTDSAGTQVGLMVDTVWANSTQDEAGSKTSATDTMLLTGNADTKSWIEDGLVDFVMVDAPGSIKSTTIPFATVINWWSEIARTGDVPFYILQSADNVGNTSYTGWNDGEELATQVIEADKLNWYDGSAFKSLSSLVKNPLNSTDLLIKYYNNEVSTDFILAELAMSQPQKYSYDTYETVAIFQGATLPEIPVTINGEEISSNSSGYFSETRELEAGENKFVVQSKDKTFTYTINRIVKVIDGYSPQGSLVVDGDTQITVTVYAYDGSSVIASLNGEYITMSKSYEEDDDAVGTDSTYAKYVGAFTTPESAAAVKNLGSIAITATYQGIMESATAASVSVNKIEELAAGAPVIVTASQAETFPTTTLDDYSSPDHYPLPKGALDYIVGDEIVLSEGNTTYRYYKLASGVRVYSSDISTTSQTISGSNEIYGMSITNDGYSTSVILNMDESVSYVASYTGRAFVFDFKYTGSVPASISTLTKNPIFSSAVWSGTKLTLTLRTSGGTTGYTGTYSGSTLTLKFLNPPSSISNATIMIDPGHGGTDPGALGNISGKDEAYINSEVAKKLEASLVSAGATVKRIDTDGSAKIELYERVAMGMAYQPHVFISVHCNASLSTSATGHEVYYFYPFAEALADATNNGIGYGISVDRGVKFSRYYVTRVSSYASILSELGFMSNYNEYSNLLNSSTQQTIVNGIVTELKKYFTSMYSGSYPTGTETSGDASTVVEATSVDISENSQELAVGGTLDLTATVSPSSASSTVYWDSDKTDIATVSSDGVVTAKSAGVATISATTSNSKTDSIVITVKATSSTEYDIYMDSSKESLSIGDQVMLGYSISPTSTENVTWSSSDTSIVTVDSSGDIKAIANGSAVITVALASDPTVYDTCTVTVSAIAVAVDLSLDLSTVSVDEGASVTLTPSVSPSGSYDYVWTSSDESVATVDSDGKVTAVSAGTATITVALDSDATVRASCAVTVVPKTATATTIKLSESAVDAKVGDVINIDAEVSITGATVNWRSSSSAVATVSGGVVTVVGSGTTTITATIDGTAISATCVITVE